jgi:hypothetical protein
MRPPRPLVRTMLPVLLTGAKGIVTSRQITAQLIRPGSHQPSAIATARPKIAPNEGTRSLRAGLLRGAANGLESVGSVGPWSVVVVPDWELVPEETAVVVWPSAVEDVTVAPAAPVPDSEADVFVAELAFVEVTVVFVVLDEDSPVVVSAVVFAVVFAVALAVVVSAVVVGMAFVVVVVVWASRLLTAASALDIAESGIDLPMALQLNCRGSRNMLTEMPWEPQLSLTHSITWVRKFPLREALHMHLASVGPQPAP